MSTNTVTMFELDVLPPKASIHMQAGADEETGLPAYLRFQAERKRRWGKQERSEWSGWFAWDGEPIKLTWAAFWA